jgi:prefoldin subunit 5
MEEQVSFVGVQHWQGVVDELGRAIERLKSELEELERERTVLEESW